MELYQLRYFLEAARQRNFTRAAERLHLAQAALSEQMRNLEAELGATLFNRGRRETTLTAAGVTLRDHAERLVRQADAARAAVADLMNLRAGRLVVGAIPSVGACVLPAVIAAFRARHAGVELSLVEDTSEAVAREVAEGRVDLGLVQAPVTGDRLRVTPLFTEPFVLLAPRAHPLARRRSVALARLAAEPFVFYKGRARDAARDACLQAGFEPRVACESGGLETIRHLVAAGLGIALLPSLAARGAGAALAVLRVSGRAPTRQVCLLEPSGQAPSPAAAALRDLLVAAGRAMPRGAAST